MNEAQVEFERDTRRVPTPSVVSGGQVFGAWGKEVGTGDAKSFNQTS